MQSKIKKLILYSVFAIIFILGVVIAWNLPTFMEIAYDSFKAEYSTSSIYGGTVIDTNSIDRLLPSAELAIIMTSAGIQLLGIGGIIATILKKDN